MRARALALLAFLLLSAGDVGAQQGVATDSAAALAAGRSAATVGWIATLVPVAVGTAMVGAGWDAENDVAAVGYLIWSGGVILGPSVANWSAGQTGRGFAGMFIRMGISWGGLIVAASNCFWDCSDAEAGASNGIFIATQAVALGLAIWEVATIKNRVIRQREGTISVAPTYSPATGSIGFAAHVRF